MAPEWWSVQILLEKMNLSLCLIGLIVLLVCASLYSEDFERTKSSESVDLGGFNAPLSEINALYDLYNATNGAGWKWLVGAGNRWEFTADANPCADKWQGIICNEFPPFHIISISLMDYRLVGTLPDSIGDFPELLELRITINDGLNGTLPDTIAELSKVLFVDLSLNRLSGFIPDSFSQLNNLQQLYLFENKFIGEVPIVLCEMSKIRYVDVSHNRFHGTLPDCFRNVHSMRFLALAANNLNGTIPESYGEMSQLWGIDLHGNSLTGRLPGSWGNLPHMQQIYLHKNDLSGPIPASWGNLWNLTALFLFDNKLSQSLPHELGRLRRLRQLDIANNRLTGHFASILSNLTDLRTFNIYTNQFSGTIPTAMGNLSHLDFAEMHDNLISGTIPSELFFSLTNLITFEVGNNLLSGTLPEVGSGIADSLVAYRFGNNHFWGTIPTSLSLLYKLQSLFLNDNYLSGTIPAAVISQLPDLVEILLQGNALTGGISGVFNHSSQTVLRTIQLSNNQLTGEIPGDIFKLRILFTFAAVSNCFSTVIPLEICDSNTLVTLLLDGLQSARACQELILPGLSNSYVVRHPLAQTVPSCLLHMHLLETLHLSGNGITGEIPAGVNVSSTLVDVSLSHNNIRGPIPQVFQEKQWYNLDLAYNSLSGSLSENFPTHHLFVANFSRFENFTSRDKATFSLSLENNRISGRVPASMQSVQNISILGSNLFACNNAKTDIPEHDSDKGKYSCGSKAFDFPYYGWLTVLIAVACAAAVGYHWKTLEIYGQSMQVYQRAAQRYLYAVADVSRKSTQELRAFVNVLHITDAVCWIALRCAAYILIILLPIHAYGSAYHGTYLHKYAWSVAAAYTSGVIPTALEMTFLVLLLCLLVVLSELAVQRFNKNPANERGQRISRSLSALRNPGRIFSVMERVLIYALFMSISFIVVLGVNVLYVYVVLYKTSDLLLFIQLLLSFFKLFWNTFCAKYLKYWTVRVVSRSEEAGDVLHVKEFMFVQLLVALVNNIVIPCFVVAVVSPNCFYNVFVPPPAVEASYTFYQCETHNDYTTECVKYTRVNAGTSYHPPFKYTYQCSSSIITYYAPAFVFLCITATFAKPLWQILTLALYRMKREPDSYMQALANRLVPKILRTLDPLKVPQPNLLSPYYDANRITVLMFSYLGMLMTFGAVFPPLAIALLLSALVIAYNGKLRAGRLLCLVAEKNIPQYLQVLENECARTSTFSSLPQSIWMVVTVSSLFYTLFLFDMLGDAAGFGDAYWVLIVMPLVPCVLYIINSVCCTYYPTWLGAVYKDNYDKRDSEGSAAESEEEETSATDDHQVTMSPFVLSEHSKRSPGSAGPNIRKSYASDIGIEFMEMGNRGKKREKEEQGNLEESAASDDDDE